MYVCMYVCMYGTVHFKILFNLCIGEHSRRRRRRRRMKRLVYPIHTHTYIQYIPYHAYIHTYLSHILQAPVDDDLLASFFTEISTKPDPAARPGPADDRTGGGDTGAGADSETDKKAENTLTEKYVTQDLGDGRAQVERLTGPHYEWKNLNPYNVFQVRFTYTIFSMYVCMYVYM